MKYSILNCWTDKNKGDLGIILSTVEEIYEQDKEANIIGISCYSEKDDLYKTEHKILTQYVDLMYPAIFGLLVLKIGKFSTKSKMAKVALGIFETIRMMLTIILPKKIAKIFLYKFEKRTLEAIIKSDVSIAKGGSVFTDYGNLRGKLALFRMCMFYFLLKKFNCPYYILGQSFGPVDGTIPSWLVNKVIENSEKVYVRETVCLNYENLKFPSDKLSLSNDTAFILRQEETNENIIDIRNFNVGLTVRPTSNNTSDYVSAIVETIKYAVDNHNAYFHIFPQVTGKDEPDEKTANIICEKLDEKYRKNLILHSEDYRPQQLKFLYGKMKMFIGTRLHSTIFALGSGTPSIGIVYHGTKAQGIFEQLGISELIVQDICSDVIIQKMEYVIKDYNNIKDKIESNLINVELQVINSIAEIIEETKLKSSN